MREALAVRRKTLGDEHPAVGTALNNLGLLLKTMGDYEAAEPLLLQSHEALRSSHGAAHTETVAVLNRIIELYESWGKPDHAAEFRAMLPAPEDAAMLPADEASTRLPTPKGSAAPSP